MVVSFGMFVEADRLAHDATVAELESPPAAEKVMYEPKTVRY